MLTHGAAYVKAQESSQFQLIVLHSQASRCAASLLGACDKFHVVACEASRPPDGVLGIASSGIAGS